MARTWWIAAKSNFTGVLLQRSHVSAGHSGKYCWGKRMSLTQFQPNNVTLAKSSESLVTTLYFNPLQASNASGRTPPRPGLHPAPARAARAVRLRKRPRPPTGPVGLLLKALGGWTWGAVARTPPRPLRAHSAAGPSPEVAPRPQVMTGGRTRRRRRRQPPSEGPLGRGNGGEAELRPTAWAAGRHHVGPHDQ